MNQVILNDLCDRLRSRYRALDVRATADTNGQAAAFRFLFSTASKMGQEAANDMGNWVSFWGNHRLGAPKIEVRGTATIVTLYMQVN